MKKEIRELRYDNLCGNDEVIKPHERKQNRVYQFFRKWFPEKVEEKYQRYISREGCYGMSEEEE
tara:strand:- start:1672 stop:1863 length:192 start_codon:yes stop_codon:yes gene_type:complete